MLVYMMGNINFVFAKSGALKRILLHSSFFSQREIRLKTDRYQEIPSINIWVSNIFKNETISRGFLLSLRKHCRINGDNIKTYMLQQSEAKPEPKSCASGNATANDIDRGLLKRLFRTAFKTGGDFFVRRLDSGGSS